MSEARSRYVIRDHCGVFVEAGCNRHSYVADLFISELLASREGLEAAAQLGIPKVIIQTNCSSLEKLWQEKCQSRTEGAHVVREMKVLCSGFQEVKLLHVGRDANKARAKEALSIGSFCFDEYLDFLLM